MENVCRNTKVHLHNGDTIEGWVYAETHQAFYISLDFNGENIRLIPRGKYQAISYSDENISKVIKDRCAEPENIYRLNEQIDQPLKTALGKIDQNLISRLGQSLNLARPELMHYEHFRYDEENALKLVKNVFETNNVLRYELLMSEVDKVILEHSEEIQKIISTSTLPLIDGYVHPHDIEQLIQFAKKQNYVSETNLGSSYADKIRADDILELAEDQEKKEEKSKKDNRPRKIRKISAGFKIANGGVDTAANIAIGSLVGIVSALPTLGIGAVAASVGIATSIYTGLNTTCEGLKDLATAIENK